MAKAKEVVSLLVLYYLRFWARLKLKQINPTIVGVTGSAGKSSCVAAIEAILKEKYLVKTTGTTNSESGLPLSILDLKMQNYDYFDWFRVIFLAPFSLILDSRYQILVCEMGVDSLDWPKNMSYLLSVVQPKIGVLLNVLPVHTLQMKSVENILKEKGKLINSLPSDGMAIINPDLNFETQAKIVKIKPIKINFDKYALTDDYDFTFGAAIAVAKALGISETDSKQFLLKNFKLPPGRASIFNGINNSKIIDSSYNASPETIKSSLKLLTKIAGRKIAVLGDMRELGELASEEHKKISQEAVKLAAVVITVGSMCKKYFIKNKKIIAQFDNSLEAGNFLQTFIQPGDLILFKGSQNTIFLETAVEMCLANKADTSLLCRRGEFWDRERTKTYTLSPTPGLRRNRRFHHILLAKPII